MPEANVNSCAAARGTITPRTCVPRMYPTVPAPSNNFLPFAQIHQFRQRQHLRLSATRHTPLRKNAGVAQPLQQLCNCSSAFSRSSIISCGHCNVVAIVAWTKRSVIREHSAESPATPCNINPPSPPQTPPPSPTSQFRTSRTLRTARAYLQRIQRLRRIAFGARPASQLH